MSTITIDLRLKAAQRTAIKTAITTLETMLDAGKIQRFLALWPELPEDVRQRVLTSAPLLARLIEIGRRLPK